MQPVKFFSGIVEKVKKFMKFKDLKQFNNHMEQWMVDYKSVFTKAELQALKRLVRYAAKYPGVAFARICVMLKENHAIEGENAISRSSFERMVRKAKELGILEVIRRKRGAFFIFHPYRNTIEVSKKAQLKATIINYQSSKTNNKKDNVNDVTITNIELDDTFTASYVPQSFVQAVKPFFKNAEAIERYYSRYIVAVKRHNKRYETNYNSESMIDLAIEAFKQMVRGMKMDKVKDQYGYYFGVIREMLLEIETENDMSPVIVPPHLNWVVK